MAAAAAAAVGRAVFGGEAGMATEWIGDGGGGGGGGRRGARYGVEWACLGLRGLCLLCRVDGRWIMKGFGVGGKRAGGVAGGWEMGAAV